MSAPAGYLAIEAVLRSFDRCDTDAELARALDRIDHPAASGAAWTLRRGRRAEAEAMLERALEAMAGPANGARMEWFQPRPLPEADAGRPFRGHRPITTGDWDVW